MQNTRTDRNTLKIDTLQTFGLIRDPKRRSYCLVQAKLVFSNRLVIVWMGTQYEQSSLHQPKVLTNTRSRASGKNSLGMQTELTEGYVYWVVLSFLTTNQLNSTQGVSNCWERSDLDPGNGQPKVGLSFLS